MTKKSVAFWTLDKIKQLSSCLLMQKVCDFWYVSAKTKQNLMFHPCVICITNGNAHSHCWKCFHFFFCLLVGGWVCVCVMPREVDTLYHRRRLRDVPQIFLLTIIIVCVTRKCYSPLCSFVHVCDGTQSSKHVVKFDICTCESMWKRKKRRATE